MFIKIHELPQEPMLSSAPASNPPAIQLSTLPLPSDDYQTYVAFLSESCQQITSDNHLLYLVKMGFDYCLNRLQNEELLILIEKEDMYLNYVMHSTFKNFQLSDPQEFDQHHIELLEYYEATDDQRLFIEKIQLIVSSSLTHQISPFTYLKAYRHFFSPKVHTKLTNMLKFIIGSSISYLLSPSHIFGLCLKWTLDRYKIKNQQIHQLISTIIDVNSDATVQKLSQITQIMNEIINMNPE